MYKFQHPSQKAPILTNTETSLNKTCNILANIYIFFCKSMHVTFIKYVSCIFSIFSYCLRLLYVYNFKSTLGFYIVYILKILFYPSLRLLQTWDVNGWERNILLVACTEWNIHLFSSNVSELSRIKFAEHRGKLVAVALDLNKSHRQQLPWWCVPISNSVLRRNHTRCMAVI